MYLNQVLLLCADLDVTVYYERPERQKDHIRLFTAYGKISLYLSIILQP